jgi:TetR/AcrR family transcriptional regulator, cholesterol catabolism regulator
MDNRERIVSGASELFRKYGIKSVTMDSIAVYLGISKRTIYEAFCDKNELLEVVLKCMTEKQCEILEKIIEESENSIIAIFRLIDMNRDNFQSMSPAFQADLKKYYFDPDKTTKVGMPDVRNHQRIIERGISEKLFREDINPDLVNRCMYLLGRSILDYDLYPAEQFTRNDVVRHTLVTYLRGIATPEGLSLINNLDK